MPQYRPGDVQGTPALELTDLHAWYGDAHVLQGVNLHIAQGQVVALLGRNGSGRSTMLRAIMGLTGSRSGSVRIHGTESIHLPLDKISHLGIGCCGEEPGIFVGLSCEENLLLPSSPAEDTLGGGMSLAEIYELFPNLHERRHMPGTRLSGGEQQMLGIARILRTGANLILLDEVAHGLAPVIVQGLAHMVRQLKDKGYTIILLENSFQFPAALADYFYIMEQGQIIDGFDPQQLPAKQDAFGALLGAQA